MGIRTAIKKQGNKRGARSFQRILTAAARLFGQEGFQGASMQMVAKAAGVSKGLLHYHFESKEHLLLETQRAGFRRIHERFKQRFESGDRGVATAIEAFDALWDSIYDMRMWTPFMVEIMAVGLRNQSLRPLIDDFVDENTELLVSGIEEMFEGQIDELVVPPEQLTRIVRMVMYGAIVELAYARTEEDRNNVVQTTEDLRRMFGEIALRGNTSGR